MQDFRTRLFVFVLLPVSVGLLLQALYFSNVPMLEHIIVPDMGDMHGNSWREFGLLENLQNLVLLAIVALAVLGVRRARLALYKLLFAATAVVSTFIFLEEIDYGLHIYEYLAGIGEEEAAEYRNWHNEGRRAAYTKRVVDVFIVVWFVLIPLFTQRVIHPVWQFLRPTRWYVVTVMCALVLSELAHSLNDAGLNPDGMIRRNISEFRELNVYYIGLIYLYELVVLRLGQINPAPPSDHATA